MKIQNVFYFSQVPLLQPQQRKAEQQKDQQRRSELPQLYHQLPKQRD